jgi:hypothetical protein
MNEVGQISEFTSSEIGACTVLLAEGHQLKVHSSLAFPLASLVKTQAGNRMWMGEVCACEPAQDGFTIEIQVESVLNDVGSVDELAARFRHQRSLSSRQDEPDAFVPVSTRRDIS